MQRNNVFKTLYTATRISASNQCSSSNELQEKNELHLSNKDVHQRKKTLNCTSVGHIENIIKQQLQPNKIYLLEGETQIATCKLI